MLEYFESHYLGLVIITLIVLTIGTWIAWLFSLGRFKNMPGRASMMFVLADLIVNIIDDFRHFLALVVISIFALALGYAMYLATNLDTLTTAMQLVMSSLGGLVGSIVGYYFGESAVKKALKLRSREESERNAGIQEASGKIQTATPPPKS